MKKQEYPKFIQNTPHCVDKYEGRSSERSAKAIENHIESIDSSTDQSKFFPKIVGLDGEWGSGKSNVVGILKKNIAKKYHLFEYDAWGHQEDLQRRSFLETLTNELLIAEDGNLLPDKCSRKTKENKSETWTEKLKYLLARKRETTSKTRPKISSGIIGAVLLFVFTPITSAIASDAVLNIYQKLLIASSPVIAALLVWVIISIIKKKLIWSELFEIYNNERIEDIINETISESEPTVKEFKEWMNDLSTDLKKKLIIVFDNMDRLPAEKVKELWSSIHTFFSDNSYENIWVIITFDKNHLANAFGDEGNSLELMNHFINKTFPVIYRVAPPVLTDWKKVFYEFFEEAFGDNENESKESIQRLFVLVKLHFTPRDIIAFINDLVSLKRTWNEEIPLLSMAIFSLRKEEILESPVESILSGTYLHSVENIIKNTEELQGFVAALTYGVNVTFAAQIPLIQYIQNALKGESNYDINKYSELNHFIHVLDDQIRNLDPALSDNAILSLSELDTSKSIKIINQWNELVTIYLNQEVDSLKLTEVHKILLRNADDVHKNLFTRYLCDGFRNSKEFDGKLFYITMHSLEGYIKETQLDLSLDQFILEQIVTPEIFIAYSNQAKEEYQKYKLVCDNKELNDYLIGLMPNSLPSMDFIKYISITTSYSFEDLVTRIESAFSTNEIDENNFPEISKTYKILSKEKPLNQDLPQAQIINLLNLTKDKTSDAYYDLVAMTLSHQYVDTPFIEGLDEKIAERIEYYRTYDDLLILSANWASDLLRKAVKDLTENSYGESYLSIVDVLPLFEQIKNAIGVSERDFLNRLEELSRDETSEIDIDNLKTVIPDYNFYKYSSDISNNLTKNINKVAIAKLKTIAIDDLYAQRNVPTDYWHNCASILIQGGILTSLPLNLTEYCKKILNDIGDKNESIPVMGSILDVFLNKADKRKLLPTIKTICDKFCNTPNSITPELFMFFAPKFDFIKKMNSRHDDITRNILHHIISDPTCLNHILENQSVYINTIRKAGEDAEDLKSSIIQIMRTNDSTELMDFASAIGVEEEQESHEE